MSIACATDTLCSASLSTGRVDISANGASWIVRFSVRGAASPTIGAPASACTRNAVPSVSVPPLTANSASQMPADGNVTSSTTYTPA